MLNHFNYLGAIFFLSECFSICFECFYPQYFPSAHHKDTLFVCHASSANVSLMRFIASRILSSLVA